MIKREQFAISLRKEKKKHIISKKRNKLYDLVRPQQLPYEEYLGYWCDDWNYFYEYLKDVIPDLGDL